MSEISHKKILVVSRVDYSTNGISSVIRGYYTSPIFKGWDITFVLPPSSDKAMTNELEEQGFKVVFLNNKKVFAYYSALKKLLKAGIFDVIHAHGSSATLFTEIHAAKKAGVPMRIAHSHSTGCKYKTVHRLLKSRLNKEITHAIACSDFAGKWLFNREYTVLPNGVDVKKFGFDEAKRMKIRNELGFKDEMILGHVGNMDPVKNQLFLLNIIATLSKRSVRAKLLFVGSGALREQIEERIKELRIEDKVMLLGSRNDTDRLYPAMDCFLLPSFYEGLPVSLIEAQATGLKCFVSDKVTRQADITGTLEYLPIGEGDEEKWCDAICSLKPCDRSVMTESVQNSCYNIDNSVIKLKELFNENTVS